MLELVFLCIFVLQKKVLYIWRSEIIEINHIENMISFKSYRANIISALIFSFSISGTVELIIYWILLNIQCNWDRQTSTDFDKIEIISNK